MLWQERESGTTRAYFAAHKPLTAKGRFALARVLLAEGRQREAQALVREGWRGEGFSEELENQVIETFGELLTSADIKARMDARLYAGDVATANRMARRLGGAAPAIVKARIAAAGKAENATELVAALPDEVRDDPGVIFARLQVLRRTDKVTEAAHLMVRAPRDPAVIHNTDEWWVERRLLSRKLLDHGDARSAYIIARDAAPPSKENYRVEHQFTAGWIAFRFLGDERAALAHFSQIPSLTINPIALSRAGYWQGRVFEALGRNQEARAQFEYAAKYPTAYYGQLARARLGRTEVALKRPESRSDAQSLELVRALELLYTVDARELVIPLVIDVAEHAVDSGALAAMAEITARHNDARAMLLLGKTALGRGLALDHYAFPTIGVPQFSHVGPEVDRTVVYSIVRQESQFNQKTVSTANALGLMQVTPEAGREVARKYGARYDQKRLLSDPTYNTQMGAAEIGELVRDYSGCYVLSFAAYNAGRGRVREWIDRYGDPRDPKVDPVDWVERIPFSETRNYVQRVVENLQVYRVRFGAGHRLMSEAELRGNPR